MGAVAVAVAVAEGEGVGVAGVPETVELGGIPEGLVRDLGNAHGVGSGARAGIDEGSLLGVEHVRLVVGAVGVDAIPAAVKRETAVLARFAKGERVKHGLIIDATFFLLHSLELTRGSGGRS